eukprot:Clim_evm54s136 gene=Clim_evmTU54s136
MGRKKSLTFQHPLPPPSSSGESQQDDSQLTSGSVDVPVGQGVRAREQQSRFSFTQSPSTPVAAPKLSGASSNRPSPLSFGAGGGQQSQHMQRSSMDSNSTIGGGPGASSRVGMGSASAGLGMAQGGGSNRPVHGSNATVIGEIPKPIRGAGPSMVYQVRLTDPSGQSGTDLGIGGSRGSQGYQPLCRLKPTRDQMNINCCDVAILRRSSAPGMQAGVQEEEQVFRVSQALQEKAMPVDLFRTSALPLLKRSLEGENCVLFVSGVTASSSVGRVAKMDSLLGDEDHLGLLPATFDTLFAGSRTAMLRPFIMLPPQNEKIGAMNTGGGRAVVSAKRIFGIQSQSGAKKDRKSLENSLARAIRGAALDEFVHRPDSDMADAGNLGLEADMMISVFVSMVSISEQTGEITDLLKDLGSATASMAPVPGGKSSSKSAAPRLAKDNSDITYAANTTYVPVGDTAQAVACYQLGMVKAGRRALVNSGTASGTASQMSTSVMSSHLVFTITVAKVPHDRGDVPQKFSKFIRCGQLSFVDLGCAYSGAAGGAATLQTLGSVLNTLHQSKRKSAMAAAKGQSAGPVPVMGVQNCVLTSMFAHNFTTGKGAVGSLLVLPNNDEYRKDALPLLKLFSSEHHMPLDKRQLQAVSMADITESSPQSFKQPPADHADSMQGSSNTAGLTSSNTCAPPGTGASPAVLSAQLQAGLNSLHIAESRFESLLQQKEREWGHAKNQLSEVDSLYSKVRELTSERDELSGNQYMLEQEIEDLRSERQRYELQCNDLRVNLDSKDKQLRRSDADARYAQNENSVLKKKLEQIQSNQGVSASEFRQLKQELREKNRENLSLREQLEDLDERYRMLQHQRYADLDNLRNVMMERLQHERDAWTADMAEGIDHELTALERELAQEKGRRRRLQAGRPSSADGDRDGRGGGVTRFDSETETGTTNAWGSPGKPAGTKNIFARFRKGHKKVVEHKADDIVSIDAVMNPAPKHPGTRLVKTSAPKVGNFVGRLSGRVRADSYLLRHQERDGKQTVDQVIVGNVQKSASGTGVSVAFTGMEERRTYGKTQGSKDGNPRCMTPPARPPRPGEQGVGGFVFDERSESNYGGARHPAGHRGGHQRRNTTNSGMEGPSRARGMVRVDSLDSLMDSTTTGSVGGGGYGRQGLGDDYGRRLVMH